MDMMEITAWLKSAYDKTIVFIVLFCLLFSALLLTVFVDREKKELKAARWEQPDTAPKKAQLIDVSFLQESMNKVKNPFQVGAWSNRMMVAELRVSCIACGRPIPMNAAICPFKNCRALQPVPENPETKDSDLDGIPDMWEKKYGLNYLDPHDAHLDIDYDGFSALEEFNFKTHPRDAASAPSPVAKLRLLKVGRLPMPLTFQGVQRPTKDSLMFVVRNKYTLRDYYVKTGSIVEGYEIVGYKPKTRNVHRGGVMIKENISVLTLRKDNRDTHLTVYSDKTQGELAAKLGLLIDKSTYLVKTDDVISVKKDQYKVIDIKEDAVIVYDISTGSEIVIVPCSEAEKEIFRRQ